MRTFGPCMARLHWTWALMLLSVAVVQGVQHETINITPISPKAKTSGYDLLSRRHKYDPVTIQACDKLSEDDCDNLYGRRASMMPTQVIFHTPKPEALNEALRSPNGAVPFAVISARARDVHANLTREDGQRLLFYDPARTGNKVVIFMVNIADYQAFTQGAYSIQQLQRDGTQLPIYVVGCEAHRNGDARDLHFGFGLNRFCAMLFMNKIRVQQPPPPNPLRRFWMLDDNVAALCGIPMANGIPNFAQIEAFGDSANNGLNRNLAIINFKAGGKNQMIGRAEIPVKLQSCAKLGAKFEAENTKWTHTSSKNFNLEQVFLIDLERLNVGLGSNEQHVMRSFSPKFVTSAEDMSFTRYLEMLERGRLTDINVPHIGKLESVKIIKAWEPPPAPLEPPLIENQNYRVYLDALTIGNVLFRESGAQEEFSGPVQLSEFLTIARQWRFQKVAGLLDIPQLLKLTTEEPPPEQVHVHKADLFIPNAQRESAFMLGSKIGEKAALACIQYIPNQRYNSQFQFRFQVQGDNANILEVGHYPPTPPPTAPSPPPSSESSSSSSQSSCATNGIIKKRGRSTPAIPISGELHPSNISPRADIASKKLFQEKGPIEEEEEEEGAEEEEEEDEDERPSKRGRCGTRNGEDDAVCPSDGDAEV